MFTAQSILARLRRQPFVPIRIVTSSGESHEVRHPDMVMVGMRELTIGLASKKNPSIYDQQSWVSILHVTAIEDLSHSAKVRSNGKK